MDFSPPGGRRPHITGLLDFWSCTGIHPCVFRQEFFHNRGLAFLPQIQFNILIGVFETIANEICHNTPLPIHPPPQLRPHLEKRQLLGFHHDLITSACHIERVVNNVVGLNPSCNAVKGCISLIPSLFIRKVIGIPDIAIQVFHQDQNG